MASKRNDGKALERLVTLIQEALKDVENTRVLPNERLPYKIGKRHGQIDVLIQTRINGFDYQTAVECKDHGRPVTADKVDAFNSKCERLVGIDKKVIVSSHGFQEGAVDAAYHYGVLLCHIENASIEVVSDWINPEEIRQIRIEQIDLFDYQVIFKNNSRIQKEHLHPLTTVFLSNGEELHLTQLIIESELENRHQLGWQLANELLNNESMNQAEEMLSVKIYTFFSPTSITLSMKTESGAILEIERVEFGINYHCRLFQPVDIRTQQYKDFRQVSVKADALAFQIGNKSANLIRATETQKIKYFVTDEDGVVEELIEVHPLRDENT